MRKGISSDYRLFTVCSTSTKRPINSPSQHSLKGIWTSILTWDTSMGSRALGTFKPIKSSISELISGRCSPCKYGHLKRSFCHGILLLLTGLFFCVKISGNSQYRPLFRPATSKSDTMQLPTTFSWPTVHKRILVPLSEISSLFMKLLVQNALGLKRH